MSHVVAIDGPSGSGKSTVARAVADALELPVLDTGAMYRAVTLAVLQRRLATDDETACGAVARDVELTIESRVSLDGRDVTEAIRAPDVTGAVSAVSAHPAVRRALVARQQSWIEHHGGGVVEGRDIGTVVFPDATLKVYLTASDEERARRRQRDEVAAARDVDVTAVREALERRDHADSTRAVSPLQIAPDALVIDTTQRAIADIVATIVEEFRARVEQDARGTTAP